MCNLRISDSINVHSIVTTANKTNESSVADFLDPKKVNVDGISIGEITQNKALKINDFLKVCKLLQVGIIFIALLLDCVLIAML